MVEAVKDVIITEEVLVVSEVIEILEAENAEVLVVEVSGLEKKVVLEAPATLLQEKAASEAKKVLLQEKVVLFQRVLVQKENQVQHKEKKKHQDVLKALVMKNQLDVLLKRQKLGDQGRANALKFQYFKFQIPITYHWNLEFVFWNLLKTVNFILKLDYIINNLERVSYF